MPYNFLNAPRTVVRSFLLFEDKVDDLQPLPFSVVHRIGCPAVLFGEIADTHAAVIHQVAVPFVHTAFGVLLGGIDHLIHQSLDALIFLHISGRPSSCLCPAGGYQNQLDMRARGLFLFVLEDMATHATQISHFPLTDNDYRTNKWSAI